MFNKEFPLSFMSSSEGRVVLPWHTRLLFGTLNNFWTFCNASVQVFTEFMKITDAASFSSPWKSKWGWLSILQKYFQELKRLKEFSWEWVHHNIVKCLAWMNLLVLKRLKKVNKKNDKKQRTLPNQKTNFKRFTTFDTDSKLSYFLMTYSNARNGIRVKAKNSNWKCNWSSWLKPIFVQHQHCSY